MGFVKLLSPEARRALSDGWGVPIPQHPVVAKVFSDCRNAQDFPIKSTDARGFNKRSALSEAQNHRCCYCGTQLSNHVKDDHPDRATVDHVIPKIAGGHCKWDNEVMACRLCNHGRGAMNAYRYFEAVQQMGRYKAAAWGNFERIKHQKKINSTRGHLYVGPELANY